MMLSHVSMLLAATALLMTMEPVRASLNMTNDELDCYLEARLSITSDLIDSALRKMTNDFKKKLSRKNQCESTKPLNCSLCIHTHCETGPMRCSSSTYDVKPMDCSDVYRNGNHTNGIYVVWPQWQSWITNQTNKPLLVYCDMETDGGGWTVIQRRGDYGYPSDFFNREWNDYKSGFGDLEKEFWIGNDNLFALTNQRPCQIKFDLWDSDNFFKYAIYKEFRVDNETQGYKLHANGYNGTAGDSFGYQNGSKFSTKDRDNDDHSSLHCATKYSGAWWHKDCHYSHLNGLYDKAGSLHSESRMSWYHFSKDYRYHALRVTNMKIRPMAY